MSKDIVADAIKEELEVKIKTEHVGDSISDNKVLDESQNKDDPQNKDDAQKQDVKDGVDSATSQRHKSIVMDFHNALDAYLISVDEITTFIIAAFQEEDIVLLREFINDVLQAHDREIFDIFVEQLLEHRSSPFFEAISQKIVGSEVQDVLSWYVSGSIKWYKDNLDLEEQDIIITALIKNALNVVYLLSTQIKASFVDAVIRSCSPSAVITLLKRTDNVECAKEAVAHYLISKLSEIDILDSDNTIQL